MDLTGKVIKCLSIEHGKKIIEFFESNGIVTNYTKKLIIFCYYGCNKKGVFSLFLPSEVEYYKFKIIKLPSVFPREIKVKIQDKWMNRIAIFEKDNKVITINSSDIDTFEKDLQQTSCFYTGVFDKSKVKELWEFPTIVELTMEEIAKKFNIPLNQLRIKK